MTASGEQWGPFPKHEGWQAAPFVVPTSLPGWVRQSSVRAGSRETPVVASAPRSGTWEWGSGGPCLGDFLHLGAGASWHKAAGVAAW